LSKSWASGGKHAYGPGSMVPFSVFSISLSKRLRAIYLILHDYNLQRRRVRAMMYKNRDRRVCFPEAAHSHSSPTQQQAQIENATLFELLKNF
jgi:hypothetical protein